MSRENESESAGQKIASSLSAVMRTPKNIFLLAETKVSIEKLQDVMQDADHTLNILQEAGTEGGISPLAVPHFKQRLCKELNAGEALLIKCQDKTNELVGLHLDSCNNSHIQKLTDDLSSCKKDFVNVRERSKYFLPVGSMDPVMLQLSQDPAKTTVQHIESQAEDPAKRIAKDKREYRGSSFKRGSNRIIVHLHPAPAKDKRESTTAPRGSGRSQRRSSGKRSDRGSSFEKSSNGILVHLPPGTKPVSSALFGPSELGNDHDHNNQLFPESGKPRRVNINKHRSEPSITHLFKDSCGGDTSVYNALSHLKQGMQSIAPLDMELGIYKPGMHEHGAKYAPAVRADTPHENSAMEHGTDIVPEISEGDIIAPSNLPLPLKEAATLPDHDREHDKHGTDPAAVSRVSQAEVRHNSADGKFPAIYKTLEFCSVFTLVFITLHLAYLLKKFLSTCSDHRPVDPLPENPGIKDMHSVAKEGEDTLIPTAMAHPSSSQPSMRAEAHTDQSEGQPEPDPHSDGPDKVPPNLPQLLPGGPHQVEPPVEDHGYKMINRVKQEMDDHNNKLQISSIAEWGG